MPKSNYFYFGITCDVYEFLQAEIKLRTEQGFLSFKKINLTLNIIQMMIMKL